MTLPLSNPQIATSLAMTGIAVPRRLRRGTCCSTDHISLPVWASRPRSRPSTERSTTTCSPIAGADSNSELTCARQSWRPVAPSSAIDVALAGSHHDHAEIRGRSGRERQFQILFPQMAARIERDREHFALVRGGVHRLVVDCGPQAEPQYHLLLAAAHALTPELLDRQRLRKVDELRRRLDILVLAAARSDDQGREA